MGCLVFVVVAAVLGKVIEQQQASSAAKAEAALSPEERRVRDSTRAESDRLTALQQRGDAAVRAAKAAVTSRLKDPESVRFGRTWAGGDSMLVGCGYVNAKNSFGGYTGEELFAGNAAIAVTESDLKRLTGSDRAAARALMRVCDTVITITRHR